MVTEARWLYDIRTRVTFFLPTAQASEEKAVYDSISYLEQQRTRRVTVTGYTQSRLRNAVCRGGWLAGRDWVREGVALVVVDDGYPRQPPTRPSSWTPETGYWGCLLSSRQPPSKRCG